MNIPSDTQGAPRVRRSARTPWTFRFSEDEKAVALLIGRKLGHESAAETAEVAVREFIARNLQVLTEAA